jgi:hypothetical protein
MVDLTSFRQALADLQRQVDELDGIKAGYHEEVLEGEDEVSPSTRALTLADIRSGITFLKRLHSSSGVNWISMRR